MRKHKHKRSQAEKKGLTRNQYKDLKKQRQSQSDRVVINESKINQEKKKSKFSCWSIVCIIATICSATGFSLKDVITRGADQELDNRSVVLYPDSIRSLSSSTKEVHSSKEHVVEKDVVIIREKTVVIHNGIQDSNKTKDTKSNLDSKYLYHSSINDSLNE